jgi:hypothetical protein
MIYPFIRYSLVPKNDRKQSLLLLFPISLILSLFLPSLKKAHLQQQR